MVLRKKMLQILFQNFLITVIRVVMQWTHEIPQDGYLILILMMQHI